MNKMMIAALAAAVAALASCGVVRVESPEQGFSPTEVAPSTVAAAPAPVDYCSLVTDEEAREATASNGFVGTPDENSCQWVGTGQNGEGGAALLVQVDHEPWTQVAKDRYASNPWEKPSPCPDAAETAYGGTYVMSGVFCTYGDTTYKVELQMHPTTAPGDELLTDEQVAYLGPLMTKVLERAR